MRKGASDRSRCEATFTGMSYGRQGTGWRSAGKRSTTGVGVPVPRSDWPDMMIWRPSAPVTTEGYQRPTDMSWLRNQVSVHGSNTKDSLAPLPPFPPTLPPKTPTIPLGRKECPAQKKGAGRGA